MAVSPLTAVVIGVAGVPNVITNSFAPTIVFVEVVAWAQTV